MKRIDCGQSRHNLRLGSAWSTTNPDGSRTYHYNYLCLRCTHTHTTTQSTAKTRQEIR